MRLIIGLGNPGKKYEHTRHNIGYRIVDALASSQSVTFSAHKTNAQTATYRQGDDTIIIAKPACFMNESGIVVQALLSFYSLQPKDIIVCHDEIDLPLETIRIVDKNSSAGHNGVQSIIDHLKTNEFIRVRVGIGPQIGASEDYVLDKWSKDQAKTLSEVITRSRDAIVCILETDFKTAVERYN